MDRCNLFRQEFQRDETAQVHALGLIYDTHSSSAELFENAVVGDGLADERVGVLHSAVILGRDLRQVNERRRLAS